MPNESNLYNARSKKWPGFFVCRLRKKYSIFCQFLKNMLQMLQNILNV